MKRLIRFFNVSLVVFGLAGPHATTGSEVSVVRTPEQTVVNYPKLDGSVTSVQHNYSNGQYQGMSVQSYGSRASAIGWGALRESTGSRSDAEAGLRLLLKVGEFIYENRHVIEPQLRKMQNSIHSSAAKVTEWFASDKQTQEIASTGNISSSSDVIPSQLLSDLANPRDINAQFRLGIAYVTGRGVEKSDSSARYWFELASAQGHAGARLQLEQMDHNNRSDDDRKAVEGDIDAQFRLGIAYITGRGVPYDRDKAVYWFERAALAGHAGAELQLRQLKSGQ